MIALWDHFEAGAFVRIPYDRITVTGFQRVPFTPGTYDIPDGKSYAGPEVYYDDRPPGRVLKFFERHPNETTFVTSEWLGLSKVRWQKKHTDWRTARYEKSEIHVWTEKVLSCILEPALGELEQLVGRDVPIDAIFPDGFNARWSSAQCYHLGYDDFALFLNSDPQEYDIFKTANLQIKHRRSYQPKDIAVITYRGIGHMQED